MTIITLKDDLLQEITLNGGTVSYKILKTNGLASQAELKQFNVNRVGSPVIRLKIMSDIHVTSQFEENIPGGKKSDQFLPALNN